jgi:dihydrofolate reductase
MKIFLIAAISEDGTIGDKGKIPWHIREDLQRFKRLTMGHPIIMGRKTYESIGQPLPDRTNIVLTQNPTFTVPPEVLSFTGLNAALDHCRGQNHDFAFIIGGSKVYQLALPLVDKLFVTEVHQRVNGDTKFPDYDHGEWSETAREDRPEYSFVEYARQLSEE